MKQQQEQFVFDVVVRRFSSGLELQSERLCVNHRHLSWSGDRRRHQRLRLLESSADHKQRSGKVYFSVVSFDNSDQPLNGRIKSSAAPYFRSPETEVINVVTSDSQNDKKAPVVIMPSFLGDSKDYKQLVNTLAASGFPVTVAPIRRHDWLATFWGRPVSHIVDKLDKAVDVIMEKTGSDGVNIIGHSAGGWISRLYLGDRPYHGRTWNGHEKVKALVTLGSPHSSMDSGARANVEFVNQHYPGAYWPDVRYVCLAGRSILPARKGSMWGREVLTVDFHGLDDDVTLGEDLTNYTIDPSAVHEGDARGNMWYTAAYSPYSQQGAENSLHYSRQLGRLQEVQSFSQAMGSWLAYTSYEIACGEGCVWGDGLMPVQSARLDGAENVVIDGVWHHGKSKGLWYGSTDVVGCWLKYLD